MTVLSRRANRRATISSSNANASALASISSSPAPTTARSRSLDTIQSAGKCAAAQLDLPDAPGPARTTTHGAGRFSGGCTPPLYWLAHPLLAGSLAVHAQRHLRQNLEALEPLRRATFGAFSIRTGGHSGQRCVDIAQRDPGGLENRRADLAVGRGLVPRHRQRRRWIGGQLRNAEPALLLEHGAEHLALSGGQTAAVRGRDGTDWGG